MNYLNRKKRRLAMMASTILMSGLGAPAVHAQRVGGTIQPPVRQQVDSNGVDIIRGTFAVTQPSLSIGGTQGLVDTKLTNGVSPNMATIQVSGGIYTATVDGRSDSFTLSGGVFTPTEGEGASLVQSGISFTYTSRNGTVAHFTTNTGFASPVYGGATARLGWVTYPDGAARFYDYKTSYYCDSDYEEGVCLGYRWVVIRLQSVTNNSGYQLKYSYADNSAQFDYTRLADWSRVTSIKAINNAVEYCYPAGDTCSLTGSWPSLTYGTAAADPDGTVPVTVTDPLNRVTQYRSHSTPVADFRIRRPGSSTDNVVVTYSASKVASLVNEGVTYGYSYSDAGNVRTTTVTDPNGGQKVYVSDLTTFLVSSYKDELNRTTSYVYDSFGRLTEVTYPEGNKTQYTYDARGNVTQSRAISKTPGTPADIVTSASFDTSCTNVVTCNQPNSTTDAKGNVTDYTYNATHGGVLTATAPAATGGGIRPQTRYSYTAISANYWAYSYPNPVFGPGSAVYKLTGVSACQTGATCAGTADEVKTTIAYANNNALPSSVSSGAGNGSLTATSAFTYDNIGNRLTVDGPLSGTADTTRTRYDAGRQVVGVIGPDPDGAGSRPNPAQRYTYNNDGQVTLAEAGTTAGQTDPAWAGFTTAQQAAATYDANGRPVKQELKSGGTTYALAQTKYDALGRVSCTAQRMDPSVWASQTDACVPQTTGSYGPDRIAKTNYDAASEVTSVQTAYGTTDQATEMTSTFNGNGTVATVKDGENNLTTYEYDGHDRLTKTRFPSTTQGAGTSSTTDYVQPTYDANGNVTSLRLRDAQAIGFTFDNLNRVTAKDLPASEPDVSYSYDLLGRMTQASQTGNTLGFTYDALSRRLTESGPLGTMTSQYDIAGRRTALIWPDSNVTTYAYDVAGAMAGIYEGAGTAVWMNSYTYDNLGRRTALNRRYGANTSYSYDAVSRLSSLSHDLAGTANDVTIGSMAYNPASQLTSITRSNDGYAWTGHYNEDRTATLNGLNQQSGIGNATTSTSVSFTHDGRGNISAIGASGYGYSSENLLKTGPGSTALTYDPLGRLYEVSNGSATTRFQYDGAQIAAEYNGSNARLRRYVPGPGADEPAFWYEGSGIGGAYWYHTDERGSVIALSDSSTAAIGLNKYDPYGKPASGNLGRFGYTGQAWLPELGMWYYKARIYNPENNVARFMQSDPIGYGGGMNMYAYVGGDPVNASDPMGLCEASDRANNCTKPVNPPPPPPPGSCTGTWICTANHRGPVGSPVNNSNGQVINGGDAPSRQGGSGGSDAQPGDIVVNGQITPNYGFDSISQLNGVGGFQTVSTQSPLAEYPGLTLTFLPKNAIQYILKNHGSNSTSGKSLFFPQFSNEAGIRALADYAYHNATEIARGIPGGANGFALIAYYPTFIGTDSFTNNATNRYVVYTTNIVNFGDVFGYRFVINAFPRASGQ